MKEDSVLIQVQTDFFPAVPGARAECPTWLLSGPLIGQNQTGLAAPVYLARIGCSTAAAGLEHSDTATYTSLE